MEIIEREPDSTDALVLMNELSSILEGITGDSGRNSFNSEDVRRPRSLFVIAYIQGEAVGCGAIRPIDKNTAEVKRMYAKLKRKGIGSKILDYLENEAHKMGYKKLILETRQINQKAVQFYKSKSYLRIHNYGKYIGCSEAVCFEKSLNDWH
ncbi:GNAT family N-acetyltransferase [Sporolactobacillus shoreae]|uniref:GNAT family N-acetyltransferase n=1 Tax=Sporolactobacillus shoreae TaxID=1465501 RepID=A0A4Z0GIB7_9BACL|nr:GNAT family N-acetyltransferase [Sporolactobacillus shoreae]TGA95932.1 GNAT family N-acetyltransferase [Sporolactobacillus shoreae]